MFFPSLVLLWLSGLMAMSSVMCFSDRDRWTGSIYAIFAVGFAIPSIVEWGMLP